MNQRDIKSTIQVVNTAYACFLSRFCQRVGLSGYVSTIVNYKLSPLSRITIVNILLHKVLIAGCKKLRYFYARALCLSKCLDKVSFRELMLLHWERPDACCCLHLVRQQDTIEINGQDLFLTFPCVLIILINFLDDILTIFRWDSL